MRISRPDGDTGAADTGVTTALDAYARGTGSEHDALTAIAAARLLVPVVAVPREHAERGVPPRGNGGREAPHAGGPQGAAPRGQTEETEMALPTLVGNDGRTAVIAFTGAESLSRWRKDARPVPVPASRVWAAALSEAADAVVIDVAGPVPLVVEGARLRALAASLPPPPPHEDPDVRAEVQAVTRDFTLKPGDGDTDLVVALTAADVSAARQAAGQIATRLAARRLRTAFEVRVPFLSRTVPAVSPAPARAPEHRPRPACRLP